jgi:hypothetical protein
MKFIKAFTLFLILFNSIYTGSSTYEISPTVSVLINSVIVIKNLQTLTKSHKELKIKAGAKFQITRENIS